MLNRLSTLFRPAALACLLAVGGCDSPIAVANYEEAETEVSAFLAAARAGDAARIVADFGLPEIRRIRGSIPGLRGRLVQRPTPILSANGQREIPKPTDR